MTKFTRLLGAMATYGPRKAAELENARCYAITQSAPAH